MNQCINDGGGCRTTTATTGLLKSHIFTDLICILNMITQIFVDICIDREAHLFLLKIKPFVSSIYPKNPLR